MLFRWDLAIRISLIICLLLGCVSAFFVQFVNLFFNMFFSAECVIGMVWELTAVKHYGTIAR